MRTYTRHYRTFRQYFNQNRRTYIFEVKFLDMEPDETFMEESLKPVLEPLDLINVSKPVKSYLHENPVDFPIISFGIIWSFNIELGMSANAEELKMLFFDALRIPMKNFIIYNYYDPTRQAKEEYHDIQKSMLDKYAEVENNYKIPRMGYDHHDEDINPQDLVGNSRIGNLMKTMTMQEYKPEDKLFKFLDEK